MTIDRCVERVRINVQTTVRLVNFAATCHPRTTEDYGCSRASCYGYCEFADVRTTRQSVFTILRSA